MLVKPLMHRDKGMAGIVGRAVSKTPTHMRASVCQQILSPLSPLSPVRQFLGGGRESESESKSASEKHETIYLDICDYRPDYEL